MATKKKRKSARKKAPAKRKRWSGKVTRQSHALALRQGVFTLKDPQKIAASLKRSADRSKDRKADPYRSALSMLTFYINRAGRNLPGARKKVLNEAKTELRKQFHRDGAPLVAAKPHH